jgi:hypothetical protein
MPPSLLPPPRRLRATVTRVVVAALVVAAAAAWSAAGPAPLASSPAQAASCPWIGSTAPVATRVQQVMSQITEAQELALVNGGSGSYAGNIPALPALCIPAINLEDGPQGVGDGQCCVTQLPAPVAAASTWDTSLEQQYGAVVGSEEAGKGADVNLGPTINIVRDPRWGRAFESFGEDPYLTSQMTAAYVAGAQSAGIIDQVKHYAVYNNETNRNNSSDDDAVQERAEQEIYMPAFQAAVTQASQPRMAEVALRLLATTDTTRYGTATAMAWPRLHQQLEHRGSWEDHPGELPVIEGTLIRLAVDHLPGQRDADPVWLWSSRAGTMEEEVNRAWQAFLRRFDIEHMFRFCKQQLGWTRPKLRDPAVADRWTWLVIAAYAQLHLARDLADDIRLPWQRPCAPGRLTPSRVRRGYRRLRQDLPVPASAPKPSRPGPGRPKGSKNQRPATRHDVGKTVKREEPKKKTRRLAPLNNKLSGCLVSEN